MRFLKRLQSYYRAIHPALIRFIKWAALIMLCLAFIQPTWAMGYGLGVLTYYAVIALRNFYYDVLLTFKRFSIGLFILFFLGGFTLLVTALLFSAIFPQVFNLIACGAGLASYPHYFYLQTFLKGGEDY